MKVKISFFDFYSAGEMWEEVVANEKTICEIRKLFAYDKKVICKVYKNAVQIENELGITVPTWIKGFSTMDYIGILNSKVWHESDDLGKVLVHEFVHCAMYETCKCSIPIYIKEGIPLYLAGQTNLNKLELIMPKELLKMKWNNVEILYEYAGLLVAYIDVLGQLESFIEKLKNPNFDVTRYMEALFD